MATLSVHQRRFTKMISLLIQYADLLGYELTFGDAYSQAKFGVHSVEPPSFHFKRLAVDFNLFIDGDYQESTEAHKPLGTFWKFLGGTWGGDFNKPDGNHYSYGEGKRFLINEE